MIEGSFIPGLIRSEDGGTVSRNKVWWEYYRGATLTQVMEKYRISKEAAMQALGVYDLDKEPPAANTNPHLRRAWERECRRLNPKAWEMKKAL